jgi:hypothetical protein
MHLLKVLMMILQAEHCLDAEESQRLILMLESDNMLVKTYNLGYPILTFHQLSLCSPVLLVS